MVELTFNKCSWNFVHLFIIDFYYQDMKNLGSAQYSGMKEQYADQLSKIREYSSGQLDKCHENYIFQRQRLR